MTSTDGPGHAVGERLPARAFVDLSSYRVVRVRGTDASGWLHDLVTCDVATLATGVSRRSLLLSPTGRIRADFTVARDAEGWLLLQAPDQPDPIGALLTPYVLSSDVSLADLTQHRSLFAIPGWQARSADAGGVAGTWLSPSVLGPGADVVVARDDAAGVREALIARGLVPAAPDDVERWRILRGSPRMGADFGQDALPAQVGLEHTIDLTKGCFLGQESVARIRNLGHPPWVLRHVSTSATLAPGATVDHDGHTAGTVTSAAREGSGTVAIVRVPWAFATADLAGENGEAILDVGSSG